MIEPSGPPEQDDATHENELPSLPDGGLSANMPPWLRSAPAFTRPPAATTQPIDPGSLTAGLDLPGWLSVLSARVERGEADTIVAWSHETIEIDVEFVPAHPDDGSSAADEMPEPSAPPVEVLPSTPGAVAGEPASPPDQPALGSARVDALEQPASTAGVDLETYDEPPYERIRLLLILFAIGVIVFTIWATTT